MLSAISEPLSVTPRQVMHKNYETLNKWKKMRVSVRKRFHPYTK